MVSLGMAGFVMDGVGLGVAGCVNIVSTLSETPRLNKYTSFARDCSCNSE